MTIRAALALLTLVFALLFAVPGAATEPPLPAFEVLDRLSPLDPLPERETRGNRPGVTLTAVTYATVPGYRPLRLDLYRQDGSTAARPLVVFIHGGGWMFGNPRTGAAYRDFPAVLASLAERGFVVAAIEYRLGREAAFPAQRDDVAAALAFLRNNATRLGIDPARIALWGLSAGAQLGALNAVACGAAPCVQGFAGWFGVYDMEAHITQAEGANNSRMLLGCATTPCSGDTLAAASPIAHVRTGAPPMLLLHGVDDTSVKSGQSQEFARRLREAGNAVDLVLLPKSGHGFVGDTTADTQRALQQALTATFDFFERVLRPAPAR
jgi:acetyl esterase/lipase